VFSSLRCKPCALSDSKPALELHELYQCPPIYITENGAYFDDVLSAHGKIHDPNRVAFLEGYIKAMEEARERGVDIRGYFVWSLMDNFEWAAGYRPTFGLVKVDFNTQKRTSKDSFFWYRDFILHKENLNRR
jgi:beta-glucosidase